MRLIDADNLDYTCNADECGMLTGCDHCQYNIITGNEIASAPTVEAIPKDHITKAIDKVEEYICDVETDTVKAQGMAQALDIFEQALGEVEDGNGD